MSVSLLEVMEAEGYHPTTNKADAIWLLSKRNEFDSLIEIAEELSEEDDE